jgi:hypothetical protein
VRYLTAGLLGGIRSVRAALPEVRGALLAGLTGLVVAGAGSSGPSAISRRVEAIAAVLAFVLTLVAFATGDRPVWGAASQTSSRLRVRRCR